MNCLFIVLVLAAITAVVDISAFPPSFTFAPPSPTIIPKVYPSNTDRSFMCPPSIASEKDLPPGYLPAAATADINKVTVHDITEIVPEARNLSNVAVILVKRTANNSLFFKYFGHTQDFAIETWSSSKIFAAMSAGGQLAVDCGENKDAGLDMSTSGEFSPMTPLGDLISIIVSYATDYFPPYCSNSLAGWFSMFNRTRAKSIVQDWLRRPAESLGANYGAVPPQDLYKFSFTGPGRCRVMNPSSAANGGNSNTLSALSAAEMLKRIYMSRELSASNLPAMVFPDTTWSADSETLLYGAQKSVLFPDVIWGGMTLNSDDLARLGVDMTEIERRSNGGWRTFSKDGAGFSEIRMAGEELINFAACYPDLDAPERGVEFLLSARVSVPGDTKLQEAGKRIHAGVEALNKAVLEGRLR